MNGNSYRSQQRNLVEFYTLARKAVDNIDGLNFAYSPNTYEGELPFAFIDYPDQDIKINAHNIVNSRKNQEASVNLNIHIFTAPQEMAKAVTIAEWLSEYIYTEHPHEFGLKPILEENGVNHFILQVHG